LLEGVCVVKANPLVVAKREIFDPGVFIMDDCRVLFGDDVLYLEATI
jgi:hypothetical protein